MRLNLNIIFGASLSYVQHENSPITKTCLFFFGEGVERGGVGIVFNRGKHKGVTINARLFKTFTQQSLFSPWNAVRPFFLVVQLCTADHSKYLSHNQGLYYSELYRNAVCSSFRSRQLVNAEFQPRYNGRHSFWTP